MEDREQMLALAKEVLTENARRVETYLEEIYPTGDASFQTLYDAENYSLMAGGKRIRPTLVIEFCRMLGGDVRAALPFAAAVEMVHTFSLIHDDLPCMDNDDLRRGRPTNHKVYGEAMALLAGDGMVIDAFGVAASNPRVEPAIALQAVTLLSQAAGSLGMVKGQVMDMYGEQNPLTMEELQTLHKNKTGALIRVSAQLGCLAAGYDSNSSQALYAAQFAEELGLAFQIIDAVLDATASAETLGKSVGGDAQRGKTTYLSFMTVEEAKTYAEELTNNAILSLEYVSPYFDATERLRAIAHYLANRQF